MKNRKMLLIVSLVLAMTMSLGGTLAYLTDTDADVNVMTLGNVKIVQNEQERVKADEGNYTDELQAFTDGQMLLPAVYDVVGQEEPVRMQVDVNGYKITYGGGMRTFPNYIDKIVTVTNTGNTDAYIRTIIAVPKGNVNNDSNEDGNISEQWFHYNVACDTDTSPANGWYYGTSKEAGMWPSYADFYSVENVEINGGKYDIIVATNVSAVPAKTTTGPNLLGVYLDNDVDYKDGKYYGKDAVTGDPVVVWDQPELKVYVLSQAVQAQGFDDPWTAFTNSFGDVTAVTAKKWFEEATPKTTGPDNVPPVVYTGTPADLAKWLSEASDAGSGNQTITLTESYDMTGYDWTPVNVDGYHGAGVVTIEGNGNVIKGLNAPLFAGGFAGNSGIVIRNLTIADSTMTAPTEQGSGAFICCVDSMPTITLENCHAKNVTLNGKSRTGGLIGWTSGYSRTDDGPVKSYVTITNCTVEGCTINADTEAAGGLIGHSGASDWTYTTVTNCAVIDTVVNGGSDRTGIYLGTSNVGQTTFAGCTNENVTGTLNAEHPEYGRTAHGTTGMLTINGVEIN